MDEKKERGQDEEPSKTVKRKVNNLYCILLFTIAKINNPIQSNMTPKCQRDKTQ
jgi:hypothetical protein